MLHFFQILTMLYQILMESANRSWGHSSQALKLLRQMALTGEADLCEAMSAIAEAREFFYSQTTSHCGGLSLHLTVAISRKHVDR